MNRKILLSALFLLVAPPSFACSGGAADIADGVKAQIAALDAYLQDAAALQAARQAAKPSVAVYPLEKSELSRVRELRNQSANILAQALAQRAKTGQRSPLAARQLQVASEKSGQALLVLGVPPVIAPSAPTRC